MISIHINIYDLLLDQIYRCYRVLGAEANGLGGGGYREGTAAVGHRTTGIGKPAVRRWTGEGDPARREGDSRERKNTLAGHVSEYRFFYGE